MEISDQKKRIKNFEVKKSKIKAYKFALLSLLFALTTIILSVLAYHLYLNSVDIKYELKEVRKDIDVSDQFSQEEAEALNLSLILPTKPSTSFSKSSLITTDGELPFLETEEKSYIAFNINEELQVAEKPSNLRGIPIFTIEKKETIDESEIKEIIKVIKSKVQESDVKRFELDISFTYIDNYLDLLKNLKLEYVSSDITFGIYIYPKWGDFVDYSFFAPISNSFSINANITELNQYVDYIKVMSFDYTGPKDILPGAITPKSWFRQILQYYTKKEYNKEKLILGINTQGYEWKDREIAKKPEENYSLLQEEAKVYNRIDFLKLKEVYSIETFFENSIDESINSYNISGIEYLTVFPENDLILELEEMARSYGFGGIFYK